MPFQEELKIILRSILDSTGFKNARNQIEKLSYAANRSGKMLSQFESLRDVGRNVKELGMANRWLKPMNARINTMTGDMQEFNTETKKWGDITNKKIGEISSKYEDYNKFRKSFDETKDTMKKTVKPVQQTANSFKDFAKESQAAFEAKKYQVFLDTNKRLKQFGFQVQQDGVVLNKFGKQMSDIEKQALINPRTAANFETFNKQLYSSPNLLRKTGLGMKNFRQQFQMHLLSVMFFGMQLQRVFMQLGRRTLDTYMKMTEGTTAAGQGINMLTGAFETLKYSVGEALAEAILPFIPTILDIIMKIIDFIEQNKKLVAMIIIGGAAFGSMLFLIGQIGLGIAGITTLFIKLGAAIGLSTGPLLIFFALGIALVAVFLKAWKDFPDTITPIVINAFNDIKNSLMELWGALGNLANAITGGEDDWISLAAVATSSVTAIGLQLEGVIDTITTIINAVSFLIEAWKLVGMAIRGRDVSKQWEKTKEGFTELVESVKDLGETRFVKPWEFVTGELSPSEIYKRMVAEKEGMKKAGEEIGVSTGEGFTTGYEQVLTPFGTITTNKLKEGITEVSTSTFPEWKDYGVGVGTNITTGITEGFETTGIKENIKNMFNEILTFKEGVTGEGITGVPEFKFNVVPELDYEATSNTVSALEGMQSVTGPLSVDFETIKTVLGATGGEGTIPAIVSLGEETNTTKDEANKLSTGVNSLKDVMKTLGEFIVNTFNNQIDTSTKALYADSSAALDAALAQERYNRAKQGATGA